jgi:hypothetical protein
MAFNAILADPIQQALARRKNVECPTEVTNIHAHSDSFLVLLEVEWVDFLPDFLRNPGNSL